MGCVPGCCRHWVTSLKLTVVKRWQLHDLITAAIVNNSTSLAYTPRLSRSLSLCLSVCLSVCLLVSFSVRATPAVRTSAVSGLRKWRQVWRHYNAEQVRCGGRPSTNRHSNARLSRITAHFPAGRSLQFNKTIAAYVLLMTLLAYSESLVLQERPLSPRETPLHEICRSQVPGT